jgi:dihydrofolate reductase
MTEVVLDMAMSLDGFAEDAAGKSVFPIEELTGGTELAEMIAATGAVVMGRNAYEMAEGDFTGYEYQVPIFVLTHRPPDTPARGQNERLRFTFITEGIEATIRAAREAASGKRVTVIGGPSTFKQCLEAGCFDRVNLRLIPRMLRQGMPLFDGVAMRGRMTVSDAHSNGGHAGIALEARS